MFATLAGGYPAPVPIDPSGAGLDDAVRAVIDDQIAAGLGLLTDGSLRWPDPLRAIGRALLPHGTRLPHRSRPLTVAAWSRAQEQAGGLPVKQCLPGPFTLGRRLAAEPAARRDLTLALADVLAGELSDLAEAGCPFIQVDEPDAVDIGADVAERALFVDAQDRLRAGLAPVGSRPHLSLGIVGGSADAAGPETIFGPAYDSYLFDLLAGPDNWRLITAAPAERGMVLGVVWPDEPTLDDRSTIVWAAGYAASGGRGEARIGIAPAGSLAGIPIEAARAKIRLLGEAVRLVEERAQEPVAAALDPRAVDSRSAALGRWTPGRARRNRPGEPTR